MTTARFEPTLGTVYNRIATLIQEKKYRPQLPLWALFSDAEIAAMLGPKTPKEAP